MGESLGPADQVCSRELNPGFGVGSLSQELLVDGLPTGESFTIHRYYLDKDSETRSTTAHCTYIKIPEVSPIICAFIITDSTGTVSKFYPELAEELAELRPSSIYLFLAFTPTGSNREAEKYRVLRRVSLPQDRYVKEKDEVWVMAKSQLSSDKTPYLAFMLGSYLRNYCIRTS